MWLKKLGEEGERPIGVVGVDCEGETKHDCDIVLKS
jgi:hypothetical protein